MEKLTAMGFDNWFRSRIEDEKLQACEIARVVSVERQAWLLSRGDNPVYAELAGKLLYASDSGSALPTTGDWVYAQFFDDDSHAIIHDLFPRKTLLRRKVAGQLIDYQSIAANIDAAFILQSADLNFNPRRLERYLVMVNDSGIRPIVILSKCDLQSNAEISRLCDSIREIASATPVYACSGHSGENIDSIKALLLPGQCYCLLGSSGVGKTTLLNQLIGEGKFATAEISDKHGKGRHTTTRRELEVLPSAAMIIDTPGMRELGNLGVDSGIEASFEDIIELSTQCRFSNCSHNNEKGCAIGDAIASGQLGADRYRNYLKLKQESEFNSMSYQDKKKKDKQLGKLIKSAVGKKAGR